MTSHLSKQHTEVPLLLTRGQPPPQTQLTRRHHGVSRHATRPLLAQFGSQFLNVDHRIPFLASEAQHLRWLSIRCVMLTGIDIDSRYHAPEGKRGASSSPAASAAARGCVMDATYSRQCSSVYDTLVTGQTIFQRKLERWSGTSLKADTNSLKGLCDMSLRPPYRTELRWGRVGWTGVDLIPAASNGPSGDAALAVTEAAAPAPPPPTSPVDRDV